MKGAKKVPKTAEVLAPVPDAILNQFAPECEVGAEQGRLSLRWTIYTTNALENVNRQIRTVNPLHTQRD